MNKEDWKIYHDENKKRAKDLENLVPEGDGSVLPLVPEACLFCGAAYKGGCEVPGKPFPKVGVRVFYECGASISVWCDLGDGAVHLLTKNCTRTNLRMEADS